MSATFDQAEFNELVRLISEGGADDPEELAHEVYQLLKPDGPGCWAEDERPDGKVTDWQAEYCRVHAELQGAYAEISALQRESAENRQAYERTFARLRDIETGSEDPEFNDLSGDRPGN